MFGPATRILGSSLAQWLDRHCRSGSLSGVTLFLHGRPEAWEIAAWPFAGLLARLEDAGVATRLVIESGVLTDSRFQVAQKLDLHRLATHAVLARLEVLPTAGEAPVLAIIEQAGCTIAIAASDKAEAIPGPA